MNERPTPPKRALRFLRWFCRQDFLEEIEGDLIEVFEQQYGHGPRRARWNFFWQVLRHFRPDFIKPLTKNPIIHPAMFKHNLLITYRGFLRDKKSFFINLIGLSAGLASALLIYLWVYDELAVDRFHEKGDQLYQVMHNIENQEIQTADFTPSLLPAAFKEEMPEVEFAVQSTPFPGEGKLMHGASEVETAPFFAGPDFFQVFTYPLLLGNDQEALEMPNGIILSESLARKLFGATENILGKSLEYEHEYFSGAFQVTGVMEDVPIHSTMQFDLIFPYQVYLDFSVDWETGEWYTAAGQTHLILQKGTDMAQFNAKIGDYLKPKSKWTTNSTLFVQAYRERYLHGHYENGIVAGGRIEYVRLFSLIALFILLIACVNFMNLSTAKAAKKMKEIGVKKTIGAGRKDLIGQYLSESVIMAILAFVVAVFLIAGLLPQFSTIVGKELHLQMDPALIFSVLGIVLLSGLLAGSYPAFYLSGFDPVAVLKGKGSRFTEKMWVRKGLVIFQFTLTVIFMVSVLVINRQIEYAQTKSLGFDRDNVLTFQRGPIEGDPEVFLSELKKIPGVRAASSMVNSILSNYEEQMGYNWSEDDMDERYLFKAPQVNFDAIETLGMEIVAGRTFSREHNDGPTKIIINETALKMMELDDPIGYTFDKNIGQGREERQIIGVVRDFQYGSIHHPVEPLILRLRDYGQNVIVKIQAGTEKATIEQVEAIYKNYYPEETFAFRFLDESYQALYAAESRVAILTQYASGLAILISCLGLFGLAVFSAERKTKEIGIRKVLGASVWGIVRLLSKDFSKLVLAGIGIAVPLSYFIASAWLDDFAYHIDLHWWLFAGAAGLTLLLAWLTVGWQTFMAARMNPVNSLKSD